MMTSVAEYQQAERELTVREGRRGWVIHAAVYTSVMTGLITLNLVLIARTDADFLWVPFPLFGWGIGLVSHYLHGVRWGDRHLRDRQAQIDRAVVGPRS